MSSSAAYSVNEFVRVLGGSETQLAIRSVVPIVRYAILFKHDRQLTQGMAEDARTLLNEQWKTWSGCYRELVAIKAQVAPAELEFAAHETSVRLKKDGKTPMLDLPRIQAARVENAFDVRNCAALCTDEYSSKTWTRVGPPLNETWRALPSQDLGAVVTRYRALALSCGEWFHNEFERLTRPVLGTSTRGRAFEITTVGLQVDADPDDEVFDQWLFARHDDGTEGPNFDNDVLCRFLAEAADLAFHPKELKSREEGSFWMSIPTAVELSNGDLVSRRVLYMVRPVGDFSAQVVGIGLDDSKVGDLAPEVALKVSRVLANRV